MVIQLNTRHWGSIRLVVVNVVVVEEEEEEEEECGRPPPFVNRERMR